jgi:uncharacterized protein (DUF305 family)
MKRLIVLLSAIALTFLLIACGNTSTGQVTTTPTSSTGHGGMSGMDQNTTKAPFDAQFIDSMILHHQGAISMAKLAQTQAQHGEIKTMANNIITDQQNEIIQMQNWRKQWYPNLAPTSGMGMQMGDMQISTDNSKPFDLRFLNAMVSHHQGAVLMAKEAQQKAEHQEIKTLANNIITAQTNEITQMKQWKGQWYPDQA